MSNSPMLHNRLASFFRSARSGTAMTETILLCLFIYVPVLMMVIICGDMTLDKERAHAAAAYMAFAPEPLDDAALASLFFPTATGRGDATMSVRSVAVEDDQAVEGPLYGLPSGAGADYVGSPPEFDLQYKLYSLAVGRVHITYELQAMPDGTVAFVAGAQWDQNYAGRYLTREGIVNIGDLPANLGTFAAGETVDLETSAASTDYTHYVETLTDIFNGRWDAGGESAGGQIKNAAPTLESRVGLRTRFKSPFLWELERGTFRGPRVQGEPGFEMHFGATQWVPDDDSFKTGYTYLDNPQAQLDAYRLRWDLYELSDRMFEHGEQRVHEMPDPLSSDRGERHVRFVVPGDPRN